MIPNNLRGAALLAIAMAVFVCSDTLLKLAMQGMPAFELVAVRGLSGVAICCATAFAIGEGRSLRLAFQRWVLARAVLEIASNLLFTLAILHMPIADVVSIVLVAPLTTFLGAWLLWREKPGGARLGLIGLGLIGAMLVAQPGASAASPYAMLGFAIAIFVSGRDLLSRKVPAHVPAIVVALSIMMCMAVAGSICSLAFETPVMPDLRNGGFAACAGMLMVLGHMFAFLAFKIGPVRSVAPFMYSIMIWAVLLGYFVFGDVPNMLALAGMAMVVVAGLAIIAVDRRVIDGAEANPLPRPVDA